MNNLFVVIFALAISSQNMFACDVCGGSIGGLSNGLLTIQNKHLIGLNYRARSFTSEHLTLFENEIPIVSQEQFQTLEAQFRYLALDQLQFSGNLPFQFFSREEEGVVSKYQGLGDISAMAHGVWNFSSDSTGMKSQLRTGAGVKFPTGASSIAESGSELIIPNMQLGTGSLDYMLNAQYVLQFKKWAYLIDNTYKINTANDDFYRFGNQYNATLEATHFISKGKYQLRPTAGLSFIHLDRDYSHHTKEEINEYSGGQLLETSIGIGVFWKQILVNLRGQLPVYQDLSQGQLVASNQIQFQLTYLINKK